MRNTAKVVLASVLLAGTVIPAHAVDLLGGIIGGEGESALITVNNGAASDSGLVNIGLGGGDNIVDLAVGSGEPAVAATIGTGDSIIGATLEVGHSIANADVDIGGARGLVDADVELLNDTVGVQATVGGANLAGVGIGVLPGAAGNPHDPGNPRPGNPGNPVRPVNPGDPGAGRPMIPVVPETMVGVTEGAAAECVGESPNEIARLLQATHVDASWARASNISIQRVSVCPDVGGWLSSELANSGLGPVLQNAVAGDALISASLSRSSYGPDRVFAVKKAGAQLTVFVY